MDVDGEKLEQGGSRFVPDESVRRLWKTRLEEFSLERVGFAARKGLHFQSRNESEINRVVRGGSSAVGEVVRETVCREKVATRPPGWAGVAV